jgi:cation/acetate symporter
MFPDVDFHLIELSNPGVFSIPIGFLCGYLGTIFSKEYNAAKYSEIEVRSLTGVGMEKASEH